MEWNGTNCIPERAVAIRELSAIGSVLWPLTKADWGRGKALARRAVGGLATLPMAAAVALVVADAAAANGDWS